MPAPISIDLRQRAVAAYLSGNRSYADVAAQFSVGERSLERWVEQQKATGDVAPKPARGGSAPVLVDEKLDAVHVLVLEKPDIYAREIVEALAVVHSIEVSRSTVSRALARLHLSRKKRPSRPASEKASASSGSATSGKRGSRRST